MNGSLLHIQLGILQHAPPGRYGEHTESRNDSEDSAVITKPIVTAPIMMMNGTTFGKMCRNMMRASDAPHDLAASTNILPRTSITTLLVSRASSR
ncbi:MAG: hypothetical protein M9925_03270 [Chloroflexi bacterium]|nr:hypothetical protein [Chloroflexota bacterium]